MESEADILHFSIPVSDMHLERKLKKTRQWAIGQLNYCLDELERFDVGVSVGFEDASRADMSFMQSIASLLTERGVRRIRLADTVGILSPAGSKALAKNFLSGLGRETELGIHAHNDLGMAVANSAEALKCGAVWADVSICGIGERSGNTCMAGLIAATREIFEWPSSLETVLELEQSFEQIVGREMLFGAYAEEERPIGD